MKLFQLVILSSAVILSSNVIANPISSTIPLIGGNILPGEIFTLETDRLYNNLYYAISCTLRNYNFNADATTEFQVLKGGYGLVKVDDIKIDLGSGTVSHFNSQGSQLTFSRVEKGTQIMIRNLDYTDTISVENCYAKLN